MDASRRQRLKHRSRACTEWKRENGIITIDRLSQSPNVHRKRMSSHEGQTQEKKIFNLKQLVRHI